MTVRPAKPSDASSIAALSMEVWIGTYLKRGINPFFAEYALETFTAAKVAATLDASSERTLVSQNTDGIDGFIRVSLGAKAPVPDGPGTEITTLYVQPRHHGKGIGKRLLLAARQWCRESGIPALWLATNAENTPAISFYKAQGFTPIGETHFRIGDQAYLNTVLACDL